MVKYIKKRIKSQLKQYFENRFVLLSRKKSERKDLNPWLIEFLEQVKNKITNDVKYILEIGDGDGGISSHLATQYADRHFYGIDIGTEPYKEDNYYHLNMSATDILYHDNFFDLVISQNVFEHIQGLNSAIDEIVRVLKPGGRLYASFAPVWTSAYGHHFFDDDGKKVSSVFPPFCHVYMQDQALRRLIKKKVGWYSKKRIQAENYLLGDANNKLLPEDYRKMIYKRSGFKVLKFRAITDHHHNDFKRKDVPTKPLDRYKTLTRDDFYIVGFEIEGTKVEPG